MTAALSEQVRQRLRLLGDPQRAAQQQAYMKSAMPFAGVSMPVLRKTCKTLFKEHPLPDDVAWQETILQLWRHAEVREERHAAIELLGYRPYWRHWQGPQLVPQIEHMLFTGAWWDLVDPLAINHIGPLWREFPAALTPTLQHWSKHDNVWLRRTSIIAQLKYKAATDESFLWLAILNSAADDNFFARKAIGWALREYAKTAPRAVVDFVNEHHKRLSPLSRREALRILKKEGFVQDDGTFARYSAAR